MPKGKNDRKRFVLERKLVAQIKYYEYLYVIRDNEGQRVYTGNDENTAKKIQTLLNAYYTRKRARRKFPVLPKTKKRKGKNK